jgi:hypothetical protein
MCGSKYEPNPAVPTCLWKLEFAGLVRFLGDIGGLVGAFLGDNDPLFAGLVIGLLFDCCA